MSQQTQPSAAAPRSHHRHSAREATLHPAQPVQSHRMWVLAILALSQLMIVLDATIVTIALPTAQTDLGFTESDRQWIVTAYALALGSLLLFGGRLTDLFGRKRTLIIGLIGFAVVSAIGGASTSFAMLVTARAIQGAFAALLAPSVLSLLTTTFVRPKERGRAFGIFGAVAGGGAAIGLLLGGVLTEYLSWRWCLYVNVVFAIFALVGALVVIRNQRPSGTPHFDIPGVLTGSAGLFALVYGFANAVQGRSDNWDDPYTIGFLVAAAVLLVSFVIIQTKVKHPLLPLSILTHRYRGPAFLTLLVSGAGMLGALLFVTFYVQQTLGYTALQAGIAFLPMVGCMFLLSVAGNVILVRRVSPRILIPSGLLISAISMVLLTRIDVNSNYAGVLLLPLMLFGTGLGLAFPTSINLATLNVAPGEAGVASATVNTSQQVGGAVGTALLNTLVIQAASAYADANKAGLTKPIAAAKATLAEAGKAIQSAAAQGTQAVQAAQDKWAAAMKSAQATLDHADANAALFASHTAIAGYVNAFWWAAALFLVGAIVTLILLRSPVPAALRHGHDDEHELEGAQQ